MTGDKIKYKFCIVSYVAGSRGAFLGHQLWSRYPEIFSIQTAPTLHGPMIINGYDTWHIYHPYFADEILYSHPHYLHLPKLFESDSAKKLDEKKYNIIVTHHYSAQELQPIKDALADQTVKILQIVFDPKDHQEMFNRAFSAATKFGHNTDAEWQESFKSKAVNTPRNNSAIPVPLSILKDQNNPPDLTDILEHFKL